MQGTALHLRFHIVSVTLHEKIKNYGLVELYEFYKEGEALLKEIDAYKKHVFVESKIAARIEKEMESERKAADRNGRAR